MRHRDDPVAWARAVACNVGVRSEGQPGNRMEVERAEAEAIAVAAGDDRIRAVGLTGSMIRGSDWAEVAAIAARCGHRFAEILARLRQASRLTIFECRPAEAAAVLAKVDERSTLASADLRCHYTLSRSDLASYHGHIGDAWRVLAAVDGVTAARANPRMQGIFLVRKIGLARLRRDDQAVAELQKQHRALGERWDEARTIHAFSDYMDGAALDLRDVLGGVTELGIAYRASTPYLAVCRRLEAGAPVDMAAVRAIASVSFGTFSDRPGATLQVYVDASEATLLALAGDDRQAEDRWHDCLALAAELDHGAAELPAVEWIAALSTVRGRHTDAVRLLGAAAARREAVENSHRYRHEQQRIEAALETARSTLGDDAFDAAYSEGTAMTWLDAVAFARRMRGERGRPAAGWESLTPTESRVVELVAQGLTNPAIGERLLMSRATVKTHLGRAYAKLGVANRTELAREHAQRSSAPA